MIIFLAASGAACRAPDPTPSDYCSCLQQQGHDTSGRRDGGPGFSIVVPSNARKVHDAPIESDWSSQWTYGRYYLNASYGPGFASLYVPPEAKRCSYLDKGRLVSVVDYQDKPATMQASIPAGPGEPGLQLEGSAPDRASECRLMRSAIAGAAFVNDWKRWRLLRIARDHGTFDFRNEIGETKRAKLGDVLTKDEGRVSAIADKSVVLTELESNGRGGWIQADRMLSLDRPPYSKPHTLPVATASVMGSRVRGDEIAEIPSSRDYCSCMASAAPVPDVRYAGGLAASFLVPSNARRIRVGKPDVVERYVWKAGRFEIRYRTSVEDNRVGEDSARYRFNHPERRECVIATDHGRASIEAIVRDGREGAQVFFEEWPQPWRGAWLEIVGDRDSMCSWGAAAVRSFAPFANDWPNLTVLAIAPDLKSFRYRNQVGIVAEASPGSVVAKDGGKVSSIERARVAVKTLESDHAGGFVEVDHPLKLDIRPTTQQR